MREGKKDMGTWRCEDIESKIKKRKMETLRCGNNDQEIEIHTFRDTQTQKQAHYSDAAIKTHTDIDI